MSFPIPCLPDLNSPTALNSAQRLASSRTTALLTLCKQLEASQWWLAEEIEKLQFSQLRQLLRYADRHSKYVCSVMEQAKLRPESIQSMHELRRIPVMSRRVLQSAGQEILSRQIPRSHLPVFDTQTSGSCGVPVSVSRTAISQIYWEAFVIREHQWFQRDLSLPLAIIRAGPEEGAPGVRSDWGKPTSKLWRTGPSGFMSISTDIEQQARWLRDFNPGYLLTYPTNLAALAQVFKRSGISLPLLRQVRCIGESVSPSLREEIDSTWGVKIVDTYSSQEVGVIAVQCPDSDHYHLMAESLIVEVVRDDGTPCSSDEIGRVLVTDLRNFATPLLRYEIGDYAELGADCACGRGLPALKRIHGRQRNVVKLPNGQRHWPLVGFQKYRECAPVLQYQLIQDAIDHIEVRLVTERSLYEFEENRLSGVIQRSLGYNFRLSFKYFCGDLPRSRSGKFEEFVCLV